MRHLKSRIDGNTAGTQWGSMVTFIINIFFQKMVIFIIFTKTTSYRIRIYNDMINITFLSDTIALQTEYRNLFLLFSENLMICK